MSAIDSEERVIRVLRGEPTPEELSALLTVLLALSGRRGEADGEPLPTQPPAVAWAQTSVGGTSWAVAGYPYWAAVS